MVLQFAVSTSQQVIQWLGYLCKVLYKVAKVSGGSDEFPDSSERGGRSHSCTVFDTFLSGEHALGRDLMAQVCYLLIEEMAFRWLQLQSMMSKVVEDGLELF